MGNEDNFIYLDHAATTPIRDEVNKAMIPYLTSKYGNASSNYQLGFDSASAIADARLKVANLIDSDDNEIFFTSGATESNNWVIKNFKYNDRIITSQFEHHSILNSCEQIENSDVFTHVVYIPIDGKGHIDPLAYEMELRKWHNAHGTPCLVSFMMINNEIGTIQAIKYYANLAHEYGCYFHTDATQAVGHIKVDVKELGVDFLTASGHKFGAPKGIGFLYAKNDYAKTLLKPFHNGGQQELGLRSGTEPVMLIVGLGEACNIAKRELSLNRQRNDKLGTYFRLKLGKALPRLIYHPCDDLRYTNVSFLNYGIRGEYLLEWLGENDVYCSSGSACNSDDNRPSYVLKAIGCSDEEAECSLRFTLDADNSEEDIERAVSMIKFGVQCLGG